MASLAASLTGNKPSKSAHLSLNTSGPLECALTGTVLLKHPYFNKGSAFTMEERRDFQLSGLLPEGIQTLDQQVQRAYQQYQSMPDDLRKNTFLTSMKDQNEVLFFRLLSDHLEEMFSIIYTPTEGDAIQSYSRLFRKPEGCFLNVHNVDRVLHDLAMWGGPEDIDYIVVTDGEEILGIGDQGCGGILISVAKLVLTTLCAGVHPNRTLPVVLDCGTDNEDLLGDPLYLGLREKRVRGKEYDRFVDTFVHSARRLYPNAYIHFEDFGLNNGRRFLDLYRPHLPCFNDDVQGTGCVTLAAIIAGLRISKQTLDDLRMVVFGAGTAGMGIADQVRDAIASARGISKPEAAKYIWLIDKTGLLLDSTPDLSSAQKPFAPASSEWADVLNGGDSSKKRVDLLAVIEAVHPNVLVGTSTVPKAFTEKVVRAMAAHVKRPIILPLSNPTRLHEAVPADLLRWTDGRALVATGSPFAPVRGPWGKETPGGKQQREEIEIEIAECNNSVVFPGIGLGSVLCRASRVSDAMLVAAVQAVADMGPATREGDGTAPLLPGVQTVREVSVRVARSVIRAAIKDGLATEDEIPGAAGGDGGKDVELDEWIRAQMWRPEYRPLKRVAMEGASRQAKGELRQAGALTRRDTL